METRAASLLFLTLAVLISIPVLGDTQNPAPATTVPATEPMITVAATQITVPIPVSTPLAEPTPRITVPSAAFIADLSIGIAPLSVQFTDLSSGAPTAWQWDFGDGEMSIEQDPLHVYSSPGLYVVTLTVTNLAGSSKTTGSDRITVLVPPSTQSPLAPATVLGSAGLAALLAVRERRKYPPVPARRPV